MKWYTRNIPELGESVMCTVVKYDEDTGFNVILDEYDGYEALLMLKNLHSKKIKKNVASFLKVGEQLPLTVISIDDSCVYVSKKDIKDDEIAVCKTYFSHTYKLFSLAKRLSYISPFSESEWHQQFSVIMMNYIETSDSKGEGTHPYTLCLDRVALKLLQIDPPYMALLESKHVELFGIQNCTVKKYFTIQSYQIDGNTCVKEVLLTAIAPYKHVKYTNMELYNNQTLCNVTLFPIAIPKFELHVQCYLTDYGETVAKSIVDSITKAGLSSFKEVDS